MSYYSGIEPCDALNGLGFRTVIWYSGCSLDCKGCFNPKTHNPCYGNEYTEKTQNYILDCVSKPYIDGITISGGNPLEDCNLNTVLSLIKLIRNKLPEKTVWLYCGYTFENIIKYSQKEKTDRNIWEKRKEIILLCDVIVDGAYVESKRDVSLKFRGSSNQRVINIPETLKQNKVVLYCD